MNIAHNHSSNPKEVISGHYFTPVSNFKDIGQYSYGYIAFQRFGGYRKCHHECSWGVNLVIDNFGYVASNTSSLYQILKHLDYNLWR